MTEQTDFTARLRSLAQAAPAELPADTLPKLRKLLEAVLREQHRQLGTPWSNLSGAIGYVSYQRGLSQELKAALHRLRVAANQVLHESYAGTTAEVKSAIEALALLLSWLTGDKDLLGLTSAFFADITPSDSTSVESDTKTVVPQPVVAAIPDGPVRYPDLRARLLALDRANDLLLVEPELDVASPQTDGILKVRLPAAYADLLRWGGLKPTLRLLDCRVDEEGVVLPRRVVLEPDYLVSVTTVAECLQRDGAVPELALVNAFLPEEATRSLVVGNLVNALLDEEVREAAAGRELDFDQYLKQRLFRQNPLQLSALAEFNTSEGIKQLVEDLRRQFITLRATRKGGFAPESRSGYQYEPLAPERCFLEPAFLSARYGLQGRLDLLHESEHGYDLIELKSSQKVPAPEFGAWENHKAQAQLYRLLLESTFPVDSAEPTRGRTSILYSNARPGEGAVRPVLRDDAFVDRLLAARNALVARELMLAACRMPSETERVIAPVLHPTQYKLPPFSVDKANNVAKAWAEADDVERAYALELVRFTARELRVCLLGDDSRPGDLGGQAGLWALPEGRKEQNFSLLDNLTLLTDASADEVEPHLLFQRPDGGAEVNFREGDSLLLYPRTRLNEPARRLSALDSQVVKVSLEEISADTVRLSVRNRRIAPEYLSRHASWALEPDTYDTFRREWAGLSAFLMRPREQRALLLGRSGPRRPEELPVDVAPARTADEVVERALAAPDWFLLCGPPGTGKTKKVLRTLAERLNTEGKNVLLAAYTNRAVDEICEQLVEAGLNFTRIGSRLSTEPAYRDNLLDARLRDCTTRIQVRQKLQGCNIYAGTVSALVGKPELFVLKQFDVLLVDEASQILEAPMLGLLSRVPKWVLIGDHKQLPAVVTQDPENSAVAAPVAQLLRESLGLTNLRNSYFERMFRLAEKNWPWAHGTLAAQYRMHEELTALVNLPFYDGVLQCPTPRQTAPFDRTHWPAPTDAIGERLRASRLLFWPTRRCPDDKTAKESREEARLAAGLAGEVAQGYGAAFQPALTVGIIASYRNQVALIRRELAAVAERIGLPALNDITVDTVERYQGSQRDVIIVSFCCHFEHQLDMLVSLDETGQVDRKLNVALTRAREQLILLGNEEILQAAPLYKQVLQMIAVHRS